MKIKKSRWIKVAQSMDFRRLIKISLKLLQNLKNDVLYICQLIAIENVTWE